MLQINSTLQKSTKIFSHLTEKWFKNMWYPFIRNSDVAACRCSSEEIFRENWIVHRKMPMMGSFFNKAVRVWPPSVVKKTLSHVFTKAQEFCKIFQTCFMCLSICKGNKLDHVKREHLYQNYTSKKNIIYIFL